MQKHSEHNMTGGVFLIGLAMLFITGYWFPGILFVIGATALADSMVGSRQEEARSGGIFMIGLGIIFAIGFRVELLFLMIGLGLIFCPAAKNRFSMWDSDKPKRKSKNDEYYAEV